MLDIPDILLVVRGNVAAFWYKASNKPVGVFDTAFLPRMVGLTEENRSLNELTQLIVLLKGDVIVECKALKVTDERKCLNEGILYFGDSSCLNFRYECVAACSFVQNKQ